MPELSVLIVHPNDGVRTQLLTLVHASGHSGVAVASGERAIDAFVQRATDVVFTELALPGRDGAATIESIRWAPGGERAAVVLTGTHSNATDVRREAARLGAVAALTGPVNPDEVRAALGQIESDTTARSLPPELLDGLRTSKPARMDDDTGLYSIVEGEEGEVVERHTTGMTNQAALAGRLDETSFARLLVSLFEGKNTGALALVSAGDPRPTTTGESPKKIVYFRRGVPQSVRSNMVEECLGQVLRRQGHIDQAVLDESLIRVRAGQGLQGAVLLGMGAVTPHQLRDALEVQLQMKLLDLFGWPAGRFEFADMDPPIESVQLEMSLFEIVYRGVHERIPPPRVIEAIAPDLDKYARPQRTRLEPFHRLELPADARRALGAVDGKHTVAELLAGPPTARIAAAELMYALICVDAVLLTDQPLGQSGSGAGHLPWEQPTCAAADSEMLSVDVALDEITAIESHAEGERIFRTGEEALARGEFALARDTFRRAHDAHPEEGLYLAYLGYARHGAGRENKDEADQAMAELILGCRLSPRDAVAHLLRARVLRDRGEIVAARNAYARALALDPDDPEAAAGMREVEL